MSTEELVEEKIVETEQCMTSEPFREFTLKEQKFITAFVIMIGHHSHCPQPLSFLHFDNINKLIAYSLRFLFWIRWKET